MEQFIVNFSEFEELVQIKTQISRPSHILELYYMISYQGGFPDQRDGFPRGPHCGLC